jgi:pilus assembly protein Flp/PilA
MQTALRVWRTLRRCDAGATAIEYALLGALIAVVLIATLTALGGEVRESFATVESEYNDANAQGVPPAD